MVLHCDEAPPGGAGVLDDGLGIQRLDGEGVDHSDVDTLCGEIETGVYLIILFHLKMQCTGYFTVSRKTSRNLFNPQLCYISILNQKCLAGGKWCSFWSLKTFYILRAIFQFQTFFLSDVEIRSY